MNKLLRLLLVVLLLIAPLGAYGQSQRDPQDVFDLDGDKYIEVAGAGVSTTSVTVGLIGSDDVGVWCDCNSTQCRLDIWSEVSMEDDTSQFVSPTTVNLFDNLTSILPQVVSAFTDNYVAFMRIVARGNAGNNADTTVRCRVFKDGAR